MQPADRVEEQARAPVGTGVRLQQAQRLMSPGINDRVVHYGLLRGALVQFTDGPRCAGQQLRPLITPGHDRGGWHSRHGFLDGKESPIDLALVDAAWNQVADGGQARVRFQRSEHLSLAPQLVGATAGPGHLDDEPPGCVRPIDSCDRDLSAGEVDRGGLPATTGSMSRHQPWRYLADPLPLGTVQPAAV